MEAAGGAQVLVGADLVGVSWAHRGVTCAPVLILPVAKEFTCEKAWLIVTVDENSGAAWSGQLAALHVHNAEIGCSVVRQANLTAEPWRSPARWRGE